MAEIKVFASGTIATTVIDKIKGHISGVCIRSGKVSYEFNYFNAGEYKIIWLDEYEFRVEHSDKIKIGFK